MLELRCCLGICLVVLRNTRGTLFRIVGRRAEILMFEQKYIKKLCIKRDPVIHLPCRYLLRLEEPITYLILVCLRI